MACQWEDEQTGGHCPLLARKFTGTNQKWFTFTNGAHIDSLDPDTYNRWYDFLNLFVADQAPIINSAITRAVAPVIYQVAMGLPQTDVVTLPVDPIQLMPTKELALAAFNAQAQVRVLFDNGAGGYRSVSPVPVIRTPALRPSSRRCLLRAPLRARGTSDRTAR